MQSDHFATHQPYHADSSVSLAVNLTTGAPLAVSDSSHYNSYGAGSWKRRGPESARARDHILHNRYTIRLCGKFNSTPRRSYRMGFPRRCRRPAATSSAVVVLTLLRVLRRKSGRADMVRHFILVQPVPGPLPPIALLDDAGGEVTVPATKRDARCNLYAASWGVAGLAWMALRGWPTATSTVRCLLWFLPIFFFMIPFLPSLPFPSLHPLHALLHCRCAFRAFFPSSIILGLRMCPTTIPCVLDSARRRSSTPRTADVVDALVGAWPSKVTRCRRFAFYDNRRFSCAEVMGGWY
ncbi:hypothetical protein C8J57DRAFT_1720373 [Mycena rebaudengoi]|nr:hypothetical protein C8J57DRAFT_1720373 [Mycena rebaudengoi]